MCVCVVCVCVCERERGMRRDLARVRCALCCVVMCCIVLCCLEGVVGVSREGICVVLCVVLY